MIKTPDWAKEAIFYQIFPDRFAKSSNVPKASHLEAWDAQPTPHGYKGGDLLGVVEQLDYLQNLGVTALYFNPVFQSASNHRYHTHDYFQVDPMLGGNKALRVLIDEVHKRDMKIMLDGVFNHASRGFFQFNDILENGDKSAYLDWFHVRKFPLNAYNELEAGYDAWWGLKALPKFNTDTKAVREFLWAVATHWLEFGIDGWRLDVPNEIRDDSFWQEFRRRCHKINPEAYIVGEIWDDPSRWLQGDQFDAVMNYPLTRAIFGFVSHDLNDKESDKCGYKYINRLTAEGFAKALQSNLTTYHPEITQAQFNLLGSHDTPRALTLLKGDEDALRLAYLLLFTLPGAPCIYYGDELGLMGNHDPFCRQAMPWGTKSLWDYDLLDYLQDLIELRKRYKAFSRGTLSILKTQGCALAYRLEYEGQEIILAVNADKKPVQLTLKLSSGSYLEPLESMTLSTEKDLLLELEAKSARVLIRQ